VGRKLKNSTFKCRKVTQEDSIEELLTRLKISELPAGLMDVKNKRIKNWPPFSKK